MEDKISVAFRLNGGIGTYLIEENFIQHFYDKFPNDVKITIYGSTSEIVNDGILGGQYFIQNYYTRNNYTTEGYDLVIDINWFPRVVKYNAQKISKVSKEIDDLVTCWIAFGKNRSTKNFVTNNGIYDPNIYNYAIINGKNRLDMMDIDGMLGIGSEMRLKLNIQKDVSILKDYNLIDTKFITMQQGVNARSLAQRSPKQWSTENYSALCKLLKREYPEYKLIQVGESGNNIEIDGVDLCLLGKTDFEDLKILLKYAYLHIDGECGMVHIRKALHTWPSVVLYGQTPKAVHGYEDDINISTDICKHWCCKLFESWKRKCYLYEEPLCMSSITPEMVLNNIKKYIGGDFLKEQKKETKLAKLLKDTSIVLDQEWVDKWLSQRKIDAYWIERIQIGELLGMKLTEDGYKKVYLQEMPAYQYMLGNHQVYEDYMQLNDEYNPGHEHSLKRLEELMESLNQCGLDPKRYIAVDGENKILDGVHRACFLLKMHGKDANVNVLKLYGNWKI